jgi:ABC-2 type transport system permease protein
LLGTFLYDADLPSNWWSLAGAYAIAAVAFAGMGLGAASLIRSAEGAPAVVNVLVLPMTFLSGGFGPTRHFPEVLKAIANILPLTYLVNIVVDVVFAGKTLVDEVGAIAVIVAWGLAGIAVAARYFRWEPREG